MTKYQSLTKKDSKYQQSSTVTQPNNVRIYKLYKIQTPFKSLKRKHSIITNNCPSFKGNIDSNDYAVCSPPQAFVYKKVQNQESITLLDNNVVSKDPPLNTNQIKFLKNLIYQAYDRSIAYEDLKVEAFSHDGTRRAYLIQTRTKNTSNKFMYTHLITNNWFTKKKNPVAVFTSAVGTTVGGAAVAVARSKTISAMKSSAENEWDDEAAYAQEKAAKNKKITDEWYKQLEKEPKAGKDGGNRVKFSDQVEKIDEVKNDALDIGDSAGDAVGDGVTDSLINVGVGDSTAGIIGGGVGDAVLVGTDGVLVGGEMGA